MVIIIKKKCIIIVLIFIMSIALIFIVLLTPVISVPSLIYLKDTEDKYAKILEQQDVIDEELNQISSGWKVSRMSKVDLNILRLAVYEMKYDEDVPVRVAINEAVELSKKFGGDDSSSFVNGVLGKIAREAE